MEGQVAGPCWCGLSRFTAELDPQAYTATCEKARQDRYVRVEHQSNGMSYMEAYLPTLEAAAIQKRLRAAARGLDSPPAHDNHGHTNQHEGGPTTGNTPGGPGTQTGESEEPGVAADRSWRLPADHIRTLARDQGAAHEWYQGRVRRNQQEADFDLLSARYVGRYPPARLRDALIFRDGVCQAPGCTVPAEDCDIDHQHPWHTGGQTTARNLWALCRRHHRMKSHGHLHPPRQGPHEQTPPERVTPTKPPPSLTQPSGTRSDGTRHRSRSDHHGHQPLPAEAARAAPTMLWSSIPFPINH
jgi:hypothetical protein